ncbi:hypothetical protein C0V82_20225 [Niveispirillum cyanobacteriorum]|uniref:Uncharacterized protein n=1 Tax=Niveispirillum cyanobacteriorum TaxID=1612173 RepID=A0A2K9NHU0_9PROT|nr:hypothetical protein C0V82_20225 [Niveispirillum cyanobacteriorum]
MSDKVLVDQFRRIRLSRLPPVIQGDLLFSAPIAETALLFTRISPFRPAGGDAGRSFLAYAAVITRCCGDEQK